MAFPDLKAELAEVAGLLYGKLPGPRVHQKHASPPARSLSPSPFLPRLAPELSSSHRTQQPAMRFLVLVALTTGLVQAYRPPPSLDKDLLDALPFKAEWGADARVIELNCAECRVGPDTPLAQLPIDHAPRPGETFPSSVLRLNVSVAADGPTDTLLLNECAFYPRPGRCTTLRAEQWVRSACDTWERAALPETAFSLSWRHLDDDVLGRGISLEVLTLRFGRVASKLVRLEPVLEVKMLAWPDGRILIATDPESAPTEGPPPNRRDCPRRGPRWCRSRWCRRFARFLRGVLRHALGPGVVGLVVAAAAFRFWRNQFLRRWRSARAAESREVTDEDGYGDKIRASLDRSDASLLD